MNPQKNFWPYGIIASFVVFVTGTAALIVIACTHKADLITPDYYEQEIRYQTQLDRLNRTAQLGEQARIAYDIAAQSITVSLPEAHANRETSGRIQLYRPSATGLDRELKLELDDNGAQRVDASRLLPGLWKVRVQWTARGHEYFTDQSVIIGAKTSANASPSPIGPSSPSASSRLIQSRRSTTEADGWERAGVRAAVNPLN